MLRPTLFVFREARWRPKRLRSLQFMASRKADLEAGPPAMAEESATMAASAESPGILSRINESLFSGKKP